MNRRTAWLGAGVPGLVVALCVITCSATAEATYPSANGRIAFMSFLEGGNVPLRFSHLWVMNADGSDKHDLRGNAYGPPAFSPDGNTIAFGCNRFEDRDGGYTPSHICIIDVDGRQYRQLTRSVGSDGAPVFSRNGRTIAFGRTRARKTAWYAIRACGGKAKRLNRKNAVKAAARFARSQPRVAPTGARMVLTSPQGLDGGRIYTVGRDGRDRRIVPNSPSNAFDPGFAPDGSKLVFGRVFGPNDGGSFDDTYSDIYTMNLDGTGLRALTQATPGTVLNDPVWGPAPH